MLQTDLELYNREAIQLDKQLSSGILTSEVASEIIKRIILLNHAIDLTKNNKDEHYFRVVECCHKYYRLTDKF